jgi:hypothetical protein
MEMSSITTIAYLLILAWGIGTTIYGLYLSRKNNEIYNKKIIGLLESINNNTGGNEK